MAVVDSSKLPTGNRARLAFVQALEGSDDRVERHYLEVKSGFDLNIKADRRKVVKFILGAAHRDPVLAARHFDGHAVMVLGLMHDGVRGVSKFELMDLEQDIKTFAGSDMPGWDVDLVPADEGRDFVLIIVDPPDGKIRPVLQSSESLVSGDVYIRVEGATRKILGPELVELLNRDQATRNQRSLDVTVEPLGSLHLARIDSDQLRRVIEWHTQQFEEQIDSRSFETAFATIPGGLNLDRRSKTQFRSQVTAWASSALTNPSSGLHELAAQLVQPFALRIVNNTTTSLREVRIELSFSAPVTALYWQESDSSAGLFQDRPTDWGRDSVLMASSLRGLQATTTVHSFNNEIRIANERPAELVVEVQRFHAEQTITTPDEDVVIALFIEATEQLPDKVTMSWSLAAGDVNEVLRGHVEIAMTIRDWREPLHELVAEHLGDESDGSLS